MIFLKTVNVAFVFGSILIQSNRRITNMHNSSYKDEYDTRFLRSFLLGCKMLDTLFLVKVLAPKENQKTGASWNMFTYNMKENLNAYKLPICLLSQILHGNHNSMKNIIPN